jgi:hypothetical protein
MLPMTYNNNSGGGMLVKKRLLVFSLLVFILALSSCGIFAPRTALTADEFKSKMEEAGYIVTNAKDQFDAGMVDDVLLAAKDGHYQIEFFIVPTVDQAKAAFSENKTGFEEIDESGASTLNGNGSNYAYYRKSTADGYYVVSRIENTFIYVDASSDFKDEIKGILKELGY